MLLILGIILCGLLSLTSAVLSIIFLAYSKPGRYVWTGIFLVSLAATIFLIFVTVNRAVDSVKNFAGKVGESIRSGLDSSALNETNSANFQTSQQIAYLQSLEPPDEKGKIPPMFYSYLGFRDYYRLPLAWPYSIHCADKLGQGELYNEKDVQRFDENDNGEFSCGIYDIQEFAFNKNIFLAKLDTLVKHPKGSKRFLLFEMDKNKKLECSSETELMKAAGNAGFDSVRFYNCRQYYELFQK